MRSDLENTRTLEYYWRHTGAVTTYWVTAQDFVANFPGLAVPQDLALYDRQLLIAFDEQMKMLTFDVLDSESDVSRLFDALDRLEPHSVEFLHELPMPDYVE